MSNAGELPGTGSHVTYEAAGPSSEFPGEPLMAVHAEISPAEAADRLAIRELFDAYAHCADRRDA